MKKKMCNTIMIVGIPVILILAFGLSLRQMGSANTKIRQGVRKTEKAWQEIVKIAPTQVQDWQDAKSQMRELGDFSAMWGVVVVFLFLVSLVYLGYFLPRLRDRSRLRKKRLSEKLTT